METLRVKDQGSGSRTRIKDQDRGSGSRIRIEDQDAMSDNMVDMDMVEMDMVGMEMVDKDQDRGSESRIRILSPSFFFSFISFHPPSHLTSLTHGSNDNVSLPCLPSLSPIGKSRTFLAQFDLVFSSAPFP